MSSQEEYNQIKQAATMVMGGMKMFDMAVGMGDQSIIDTTITKLRTQVDELIEKYPNHLASCVVFVSATSKIIQYLDSANRHPEALELAEDVLAKVYPTLSRAMDSEQALTMLLNAAIQVLVEHNECINNELPYSVEMMPARIAALYVILELFPKLSYINPRNRMLSVTSDLLDLFDDDLLCDEYDRLMCKSSNLDVKPYQMVTADLKAMDLDGLVKVASRHS